MEPLATGYGLIEGPVWDAARGLLFSDVIGGGVFCFSPATGKVEPVLEHRRGIGGMALHENGGLIVSGRNISWKGAELEDAAVLLDREEIPAAVGFNDLTTDPEGRIYVGSLAFSPVGAAEEPKPGHLHLIDLDGSTRVLADGIMLTNGLGVSPDGSKLYHSDSLSGGVFVYDRSPDGSVGERRLFGPVSEGHADGLALSTDGAVWVAVAGGGCVIAFNPDGSERTRLPVPLPMVTSVCFGGDDLRDLYVVTGSRGADSDRAGTVYRTRTEVPGLPVAPAQVRISDFGKG